MGIGESILKILQSHIKGWPRSGQSPDSWEYKPWICLRLCHQMSRECLSVGGKNESFTTPWGKEEKARESGNAEDIICFPGSRQP